MMLNKQIRYYKDNDSKNYPGEITLELLHNGSAFSNIYPISAFNIQTLPGVQLYINGNSNPIVTNRNGECEIEFKIDSLSFDLESLNRIVNNNGYLIINY